MRTVYYIEVNLICVVLLLLYTHQLSFRSDSLSTENRNFHGILKSTVVMCVSDMVAQICDTGDFWGASALVEVGNLLYYETVTLVAFLWLIYVLVKLKVITRYSKLHSLWAIPFAVMTLVIAVNPLTNYLFYLDGNNHYVRSQGVYLHWIVTWFYMLVATVVIVVKILREKNANRRRHMLPLLFFAVAPVCSAVVQMLCSGVSCFQAGVTISIAMVCMTEQNSQIFSDSLTGLNNRYSFARYVDNYLLHRPRQSLSLMLIDINKFKQVNDNFGHLEGDRALADAADAIRKCCDEMPHRLFICRYGGDEFLVAGADCREEDVHRFKDLIIQKLKQKNAENQYPYELSASIGMATGVCEDTNDVEQLIRAADDVMYQEKKKR